MKKYIWKHIYGHGFEDKDWYDDDLSPQEIEKAKSLACDMVNQIAADFPGLKARNIILKADKKTKTIIVEFDPDMYDKAMVAEKIGYHAWIDIEEIDKYDEFDDIWDAILEIAYLRVYDEAMKDLLSMKEWKAVTLC